MRTILYILLSIWVVIMCGACDSLHSDCRALAQREAAIAREIPGDYYIGRRYYVPATRFWGYLRRPGQSWRKSVLVIMDERDIRTPDRGDEPPTRGAVFGTDRNVEYYVQGKFTGENGLDPNADLVLPIFRATGYQVRSRKPGFLFVPSEEYEEDRVTLLPSIMPRPEACARVAE